MKKILFILIICLVCSTSVFSQSKKKWEQTQSLNSIEAYQDFIKKYPQGKYVESAKQELAQLEFVKAKELNTITAYEDFIKKTSDKELVAEAKLLIAKIQEEEADFAKIKDKNSIDEIGLFLIKYPQSKFEQEAQEMTEKISYENAIADGSSFALKQFLRNFPKSKYEEQVREKIPYAIFSEAMAKGTDNELIEFIKSSNDPVLIKQAITKLKGYLIVDISKTIPWESLKTVYCGSTESGGKKYSCGINFNAFTPGISEISFQSLMVGPLRYYEPDVASLVMFDWTEFDGYCVKSTNLNHQTSNKKSFYTEASVKIDGLLFEPNSIVLKKVNKDGRMEMKKK